MYAPPLIDIRYQQDYPDLQNPLHVIFLVTDCNIEIQINGLLGFLENSTGEHLQATIDAFSMIGAKQAAEDLQRISDCMSRHGVTWAGLRAAFAGSTEFEITTFAKKHGDKLRPFTEELRGIAPDFDLFPYPSGDPVYNLLCAYIEPWLDRLAEVTARTEAQQDAL